MITATDRHAWVRTAARNNAEWCEAMCRAHGLPGAFGDRAWTSEWRTPPLYPDAVTLAADATAWEVLADIDTRAPGCSVKDSFASMDLARDGFEVLFEAEWLHRPAGLAAPVPPPGIEWARLRTPGELAAWEAVWGGGQGLSGLFRAELLALNTTSVLAGYDTGGRVVAGAVASRSRSGAAVGISNLFASDDDLDGAWAGCLAAVAHWWPGEPVVGYEHGEDLAAAMRQGCVPVGPLRVWLASASEPVADRSV
ncbi:hypothetical protein SLUN_12565 [Streptomyces lunaelactis]|uniref:Uncharacterized protein n=2 Tax=Streptomyces lunaelactis TaxID=1535768 RepID=A0A2R4T188_9ACTN|nr:hypothetical protein [Streptomyces lunaelactis]AVZ72896.1 hypothetical protein SLUN_12565 [Streptomyces lunaelactis]NUK89415.1 hypothetical protein [Streptomyces lunaelactis]NUL04621.1 hypothetical protein [Streptomyces lunaelactis]